MKDRLSRVTLLTLAGVSLVFTVWLVNSGAVNQQRDRVVSRKAWPFEPVKVVGVKTRNRSDIEIGKPFDDADDWLDGLALKIANNHDKTVTTMTISLIFRRDPGDTRPPFAWNLHYGPSPNSPEYAYRDPNNVIKAGQTHELRVSPKNYQSLKRGFEQAGYPNKIRRVELEIREVGFEDGSMIYSGTLYLQDPSHPNDPTKKIKAP